MNLFFREIKAARKSLILWTIGIFFMIISGMVKYEGLNGTGQSLQQLISEMPKSLQAIMGTGTLDLSTAVGFYAILYTYLLLMATIHALMLGANIIAKEERDKTAEFLLAKPISRTQVITAKLLAAFANVVIFNLVTLVLSVVMVSKFSKAGESLHDIYLLMAGMFLLQLLFMAVGAGIAAAGKKPKRAAGIGTALLLINYILSIAIDLNKHLELLQYITPFKYFEAKRVLADGALDPAFVGLSMVIITVLLTITYSFFKKRDLHV
ncbi:ABC transporter permease subunit [Neobacillus mesonae]|uniref:ABC transporter n=1 Tax=Neobacillus mesonae TaxID=1193713 RepID=A0A3Q9R1W2_9BACI|nr:ABC transporter permease subunit [Neobacillus mesonae]AZU64690.1 ABC transporter [Neobacillus mesonae]